jgi:hypothetical protein
MAVGTELDLANSLGGGFGLRPFLRALSLVGVRTRARPLEEENTQSRAKPVDFQNHIG